MTNGIFSELSVHGATEAKSRNFEMVNVRPGEKVSSMLALLSHLKGQTPSALLADALSQHLAARAARARDAKDAIMEAAELAVKECGGLGHGTALSLLEQAGIIALETPASRKIAELFRKDRDGNSE